MAGSSAHGATFSFTGSRGNFSGAVVGINVETPTAEVVDMTSTTDVAGASVIVPTGEWSGASVTVDFIVTSTANIGAAVRGVGPLTFNSPGLVVSTRAIFESANVEARVGDVVRGSAKFRVTDYQGT